MPTAVADAGTRILELLQTGHASSEIVIFAEHPQYQNYLHVEPLDEVARDQFYEDYHDWMSRLMILNGTHLLDAFVARLQEDGYTPVFTPSTEALLANHARWSQPLHITGYDLRKFQSYSMNQALERATMGFDNSARFYFWNWSAGAGKSFCSAAGAKWLFDHGEVDVVIACTLSKLKENLRRNFLSAGLSAVINDHPKPGERHHRYRDYTVKVWTMNYEKLWVDFDALSELTRGQRVLWVLDEGHKVIAETGQNKARKALDKLTRGCDAIVWPMSATVVGGSPLRFRDVFSLDSYSRRNPLGTKEEFVERYADSVVQIPIRAKNGGTFQLTKYEWNLPLLQEVRHRVGERTMAVRKTDPGIREQFKGIQCLPEWVPMTDELDEIYKLILKDAKEARDKGMSRAPHYLAMRVASINPAALHASANDVSQRVVAELPHLLKTSNSNKLEMLNDRLESIRESQDQALVFCHWTNLGILPLDRQIKVPHVLHYAEQTDRDSQAAQDKFKADPDVTCFLTSDAGTHGLNMQNARYVISLDPLYSYDDLHQRNSRIDRADSHLDGLTAYVMITEESKVENRIWAVCDERRRLAEAVQGTTEALSYSVDVSRPEGAATDWLIGLED